MRLTKSATRSPSHVSPRKSSKLYSHVQGSGYGMVSPWKSPIKPKPEQKKKPTGIRNKLLVRHVLRLFINYLTILVTAPKKKSKPKQDASEFLRDSALALLANVREQKEQKTKYFYPLFSRTECLTITFFLFLLFSAIKLILNSRKREDTHIR